MLEPEPEHVPRHAAPAVPAQAVDLEEAGEEPEAFEPLPEEEPELVPIQAEEAVREEDKVDAFLADFSLEELEDPEAPEAEEPAEPEDETGKVEEAPVASPAPAEEPAEPVISGRPADLSAILGEETEKHQAMVRKS